MINATIVLLVGVAGFLTGILYLWIGCRILDRFTEWMD